MGHFYDRADIISFEMIIAAEILASSLATHAAFAYLMSASADWSRYSGVDIYIYRRYAITPALAIYYLPAGSRRLSAAGDASSVRFGLGCCRRDERAPPADFHKRATPMLHSPLPRQTFPEPTILMIKDIGVTHRGPTAALPASISAAATTGFATR